MNPHQRTLSIVSAALSRLPLPSSLRSNRNFLSSWLGRQRQPQRALGMRHVLLCVFCPFEVGDWSDERTAGWEENCSPVLNGEHKTGRVLPRFTFHLPPESCTEEACADLRALHDAMGCEIALRFTRDSLSRPKLEGSLSTAVRNLANKGFLCRDSTGQIHFCAVEDFACSTDASRECHHDCETTIAAALQTKGCIAAFTRPADPSCSCGLYYTTGGFSALETACAMRLRSERAPRVPRERELLVIQTPLAPDWQHRRWRLFPGTDTGEISEMNPPSPERLRGWLDCHLSVEGRPNWNFVALHIQAPRLGQRALPWADCSHALSEAISAFTSRDPTVRFHYVTAREMVNIALAAEAGHSGDPTHFRDFRYQLRES